MPAGPVRRGAASRDWRRIVAESRLPAEAQAVVGRVVRRCRLRRGESAAIAEELLGHFADAWAGGIATAKVVAEFGDPDRAAGLIRRAMLRRRSRAWHVLRWVRRGLVVVLLMYAVLAGYFYLGRPNPRVDYLAELNYPVLQTPIGQRAWPMYRQAILKMSRPDWPEIIGMPPDGPAWPALAEFVAANGDGIELTRRAADKPVLGFILGPHGSIEDPPIYRRLPRSAGTLLDPEDWRFIPDLRRLGLILSLDAKAARLAGDGPRFVSDIIALLNMAHQLRSATATLSESLAGVNIDYFAVEQMDAMLVYSPTLLGDQQLCQLSDGISQWRTASDFLRLSGDRLLFEDLLQHVYTDNGAGDGRMTPAGWLRTRLSFAEPNLADFVAAPLSLLQVASRRQMLQKYDRFIELKESELRRPARDVVGEADRRKLRFDSHPDQLSTAFNMITTYFGNPYIGGSEILLGDRDGVIVGIALERYRRRQGDYPQSLNALVPAFLPAIPADRITGNPVKYLLRKGRPLVYSVGSDRIDNSGFPGSGFYGPDPTVAALWPPMRAVIRGDWILYPHAK
jgi:hypothetical protein